MLAKVNSHFAGLVDESRTVRQYDGVCLKAHAAWG